MRTVQILPYLLLTMTLLACSQSVTMKVAPDIPAPRVEQLPLTMGIYYDDTFRHYAYKEDSAERPDWTINSGESQVLLFEQIFSSMFARTEQVAGHAANSGVDGILYPEVIEMQFALPAETKTDFYEYWVKYKIALYDNQGNFVADWPVTGYGKSSTEFLKSRDKGLNAAINQALRDVGAKLAIDFTRVSGVAKWLADRQAN